MALDPIKIPQNVYIEDRIVGPLTLKQVITVAIGGGFSYFLWAMLNRAYGELPLPVMIAVWIPAVISAAFAFIRINDLSLLRIALLMIESMEKPTKRVFAPRQGIVINIRTFNAPAEPKRMKAKPQTPMEQLTEELDAAPMPTNSIMKQAPAPVTQTVAEQVEEDTALMRRPVNPQRVKAEPLRADVSVDGIAQSAVPSGTPRSSLFRDLSPA